MVLRAGEVLLPARVGVVAALGLPALDVFARPRVAIVSTGNEVVAPGTPLGPGQIYDVNRHTLSAIVEAHGGDRGAARRGRRHARRARRGCRRSRSAATWSCSRAAARWATATSCSTCSRAAARVVFHGIATRPGKPTAFGRIGEVPVFGMPGNPTSCLTNAYVLLVPFLRRLARSAARTSRAVVTAPLARRVASSVGRHQFYTVRLVDGAAEPAFKASGDITSMAHADGYIEIAADVAAVEAGAPVDVVLF